MQRQGEMTWKGLSLLLFGFIAIHIGSCSSAPKLEAITVTPASQDIPAGSTQQFKATGTYTNRSTKDLTQTVMWSTSAADVVTIAATGLATAHATGTATIQAVQAGITGSTNLTVSSAAVASIAVAPATPGSLPSGGSGVSLPQGVPVQFIATGTNTDGSTTDITNSVTWGSTAPNVASITSTGVVTGVSAGTTTIQATLG